MSFEHFIQKRQYLQNVAQNNPVYEESFKWLANPSPGEAEPKAFVLRMRERGLEPTISMGWERLVQLRRNRHHGKSST